MPYLIAVTVLWAVSFNLIGAYLAGQVDSYFAVLTRVLLALLVFLPITQFRGVPRAFIAGVTVVGALQFGITYLCLYLSFNVLTVPEVLLFTVLTPLYVTLINDALDKRFNPWALLAAAVAVLGAVIIRYDRINGDFFHGFLLLQVANITFAAGMVLYKHLVQWYPSNVPLYRRFGYFFIGALLVALPAWWAFGNAEKLPTTLSQWGILLWMGSLATALGQFWWNKGATLVDAGRLAIMNNASVPLGILINVLFWNSPTDWPRLIVGGLLIIGSLMLLRLPTSRAVKATS